MAILVLDPAMGMNLKAKREQAGADRFDEVWDGVYIMPPMPNNEHQQLVGRLFSILQGVVGWPGPGNVLPGANVSDREADWEHNYRVPDVAVFLQGGRARDLGTHWLGGPDFLVEITSPYDQTRAKLPFYSGLGVREVLLVERAPWALELYQLQGTQLVQVARSSLEQPALLTSAVVPLTFRLVAGTPRPHLEVVSRGGGQSWMV